MLDCALPGAVDQVRVDGKRVDVEVEPGRGMNLRLVRNNDLDWTREECNEYDKNDDKECNEYSNEYSNARGRLIVHSEGSAACLDVREGAEVRLVGGPCGAAGGDEMYKDVKECAAAAAAAAAASSGCATSLPSASLSRSLSDARHYAIAVGDPVPECVNDISTLVVDDDDDDEDEEEEGWRDTDEDDDDDWDLLVKGREAAAAAAAAGDDQVDEVNVDSAGKADEKSARAALSSSGGEAASRCSPVGPPSSSSPRSSSPVVSLLSSPPPVVTSGYNRGNTSQLHRKAWLEVSDARHRYGKNLRVYYRAWEGLGHPCDGNFFTWLDTPCSSSGELPDLPECPRSKLDNDTVEYVKDAGVQATYKVCIESAPRHPSPPGTDAESAERRRSGSEGPVSQCGLKSVFKSSKGEVIRTGPEGWIYVMRDGSMYASPKVTCKPRDLRVSADRCVGATKRFHHSSFFGGKAVESAGIIITDDCGVLVRLYPHSGHYRPGSPSLLRSLTYLDSSGVNLSSFLVDMQQVYRVSRKTVPKASGEAIAKNKKVDTLHLLPADDVRRYLIHKDEFDARGVKKCIEDVGRYAAVSVADALRIVEGTLKGRGF